VEILNKGAIVLLTACWEAFIEDAASSAFEFVLNETTDPTKLPTGVLKRVAKLLKEDKNDLKIWDLAQTGWRQTLLGYKQQMLHTHVSFFNTPKAGNIDRLFEALLDLPFLSDNWSWQKMSVQGAKDRLSDYVELRGSVAHRVKASRAVHKKDVTDYRSFINRLAVRSANVTRDHVHTLLAKHPWPKYKIGSFS
jgi:RiboL-PSP-HEPN